MQIAQLWSRISNKTARHSFSSKVISTFGAQLITLSLTLVHSAILARVLGPEGKGMVSLSLLLPQILMLIFSLGINVAVVYFVRSKTQTVSRLTRNSTGLAMVILMVSAFAIAPFFIFGWIESVIPSVPREILFMFILYFPINLLQTFWEGIIQGLRQIFVLNVITITQAILLIVLDIIFIVVLDYGVPGAALAFIIANLIRLLMGFYYLWRKQGGNFAPQLDKRAIRPVISYGLQSYVGNLLQFFNYRLDAILLNLYIDPSSVGIYSIAVALGELLWNFPRSVAFVIFPKSAGTKAVEMNRFTPRVFIATLTFTLISAVGLIVLGKPIITLVYGAEFEAAYIPLVILLIGIVPMGSTKVLTSELAGRGYPQYNSITAGVGMLITIMLDLLLIPRYGIIGAAIASAIAYFVIAFQSVYFYLRVSQKTALPTQ